MKTAKLRQEFLQKLHSPRQIEQLFEYLPDVYFFAKNRDSQFVMANQIFVEKCGALTEEDIVGKTDHDYFPKDRAESYIRDDNHVMTTRESIINKVELAPETDSSINWIVTNKVPLFSSDGKVIGLAGTARDLNKASSTLTPYKEMACIIEYIMEHYDDNIEIKTLAEMVHLSVSQFERKFKKAFQTSPVKHIMNVRVKTACRMLVNSNDKISTIAQETGFYDHSHFTREFIKHTGVTPSDYKKKH